MVYFEQIVDLPRVENPDEVFDVQMPLNMEVSLYYADDPDNIDIMRTSEKITFKYEKVSIRSYRVGNLIQGVYKYVPVEFTYSLASVLFTSVH